MGRADLRTGSHALRLGVALGHDMHALITAVNKAAEARHGVAAVPQVPNAASGGRGGRTWLYSIPKCCNQHVHM